jgi:hypothetical protein
VDVADEGIAGYRVEIVKVEAILKVVGIGSQYRE